MVPSKSKRAKVGKFDSFSLVVSVDMPEEDYTRRPPRAMTLLIFLKMPADLFNTPAH